MSIESDYPLATPVLGVYRPRDPGAPVSRSLASAGSTDVVNVSEAGKLLGVLLDVTGSPGGTPTMRIEIVMDGSTQENFPIYTALANWDIIWRRYSRAVSGDIAPFTGNVNESLFIPFYDCTYDTSLVVRANTTVAGSGGAVDLWVFRATKQ